MTVLDVRIEKISSLFESFLQIIRYSHYLSIGNKASKRAFTAASPTSRAQSSSSSYCKKTRLDYPLTLEIAKTTYTCSGGIKFFFRVNYFCLFTLANFQIAIFIKFFFRASLRNRTGDKARKRNITHLYRM